MQNGISRLIVGNETLVLEDEGWCGWRTTFDVFVMLDPAGRRCEHFQTDLALFGVDWSYTLFLMDSHMVLSCEKLIAFRTGKLVINHLNILRWL